MKINYHNENDSSNFSIENDSDIKRQDEWIARWLAEAHIAPGSLFSRMGTLNFPPFKKVGFQIPLHPSKLGLNSSSRKEGN